MEAWRAEICFPGSSPSASAMLQILYLAWTWFCTIIGLPVAMLFGFCGYKFGDGSGNDSDMISFLTFSYWSGIVELGLVALVVGGLLARKWL